MSTVIQKYTVTPKNFNAASAPDNVNVVTTKIINNVTPRESNTDN